MRKEDARHWLAMDVSGAGGTVDYDWPVRWRLEPLGGTGTLVTQSPSRAGYQAPSSGQGTVDLVGISIDPEYDQASSRTWFGVPRMFPAEPELPQDLRLFEGQRVTLQVGVEGLREPLADPALTWALVTKVPGASLTPDGGNGAQAVFQAPPQPVPPGLFGGAGETTFTITATHNENIRAGSTTSFGTVTGRVRVRTVALKADATSLQVRAGQSAQLKVSASGGYGAANALDWSLVQPEGLGCAVDANGLFTAGSQPG